MRPSARAAALVLLLATMSLAQEAPDPFLAERILPQNALAFLSIPQSAGLADDYAKSNLAKMIEHPEVKSFTEPLEKWWKKRKTQAVQDNGRAIPSFNEQCKMMTGLTVDEIW